MTVVAMRFGGLAWCVMSRLGIGHAVRWRFRAMWNLVRLSIMRRGIVFLIAAGAGMKLPATVEFLRSVAV